MKEIWEDIEGYENLYRISSEGRVKGLTGRKEVGRVGNLKEEILELFKDEDGYNYVLLTNKEGEAIGNYVHLLVAEAFIPKPEIAIH